MLRRILLSLSRDKYLRHWLEQSAFSEQLTSRFVAGRTLEDELRVVAKIAGEGLTASLDYLGENVTSLEEARASQEHYLQALDQIRIQRLPATVSIKLTQFGLNFSTHACLQNVAPLVARAREMGTRIEIDMESSEYTDRTLDVVRRLHSECPGCVRAVIQAYLYRSEADIKNFSELEIPVRLCKGAYREPASVAFTEKADVDANYERLMRRLLESGTDPAIASHDERMVRAATALVRDRNLGKQDFEFQMLYGIRRDLQRELVRDGFRLRLYIPYGDAWYPYFMRRLAERPANLVFLLRNLMRR